MEVTLKILKALFQGMSPGRLWDLMKDPIGLAKPKEHWQMLAQYCDHYLKGYSLNEQELILKRVCSQAAKKARAGEGTFLPRVAAYTVLGLAQEVLSLAGRAFSCRVEHLLAWREISLPLGQDLFTCAFLAWEDLRARRERKKFVWPAVLPVDHKGVGGVLLQGLAENHQHLYGSGQTFALSWCSLMNAPPSHRLAEKHFQELYTPFTAVSGRDWMLSTRQKVQYACICRAFLFRWMKARQMPERKRKQEMAGLWEGFLGMQVKEEYIAREVPTLRTLYGAAVPQPKGPAVQFDYALEKEIFWEEPDAAFRILAGERHFLYGCFRLFFQNQMDPQAQMIFYLYLVLKSQFRGEMIQTNQKVGFQNFSNYQDRKTTLCDQPYYEAELVRMAIHAPLAEGRVNTLETRITPKATERENFQRVKKLDDLRDYAARPCSGQPRLPLEPDKKEKKKKKEEPRPYFFVIHFIKSKDKKLTEKGPLFANCRHNDLRRTVRKQAICLARTLSNSPWLCRRVRGIDAASNEVVCPPEVFAQAFRFLRGFHPEDFAGSMVLGPAPEPRLSATYHVGEDFLDIAGALRAIDETVEFLGLGRGDRLGHALGLGVDPAQHYGLKGRRIYQSRQERLDDLVWLTHRARDVGVHIPPHIYGKLKMEAEALLLQIYGNQGEPVSLTEYAYAMKLRGDDPELYASGKYEKPKGLLNPYDRFGAIKEDVLKQYRSYGPIARIYSLYHFSPEVKREGAKTVEVQIGGDYLQLMGAAQDAMQEYIREKGLVIECNPSSNVLIGTFQSYEKHPIFRFNNAMLEQALEKRRTCRQLPVCVNTDDLGVFDTSQEMEYALLFQTLNAAHLEDGSKRYQEVDVLAYLEHLRQMGLEAVFPAVKG